MELTKVLVLFAAGWTISLALPVQVLNITTYDDTSFGTILTSNERIIDQLLEGDIAPRPAPSRGAMVCSNCFWPQTKPGKVIVPLLFSTEYSEKEILTMKEGLNQFQILTCVSFVDRTTEKDYISIDPGKGCWSVLGKVGGKQTISLEQPNCISSGTVQHEMIHALGFYHEQNRSDRDAYVNILKKNICPGRFYNFELSVTNNLDLPYDYDSVMHYPRKAFTITGGDTIVPKPDPKVEIGRTNWMSHLDVKKINLIYNCNLCRTKFTRFTSGTFSSADFKFGNDKICVWGFQTPQYLNQKVFLEIYELNIPQSSGCSDSYLKFYNGDSREAKVLQDKTCGSTIIPLLISSQKSLLMEFVSNLELSQSKFKAFYKTVTDGDTFFNDNGNVNSPSYPNSYPHNADAVYTIRAPSGKKWADLEDF
ncbi:high choriolytic enzyme 1-like isoform X2 [Pelobates fuscus]|uniref:high choriolytic enzyme 1-like isoform X2 n=1 Tax=Pelobates fuscus TaxID=191477 RepID=UPI002FE453D8